MPSLTNTPQDRGQPNPQLAGLMFLQPDVIALPVFAVVMLIAAFEDFRRLVIRLRSLLLLLVAVGLAGGTAMLARAWLAAQHAQVAEASPLALPAPAKSVLVARNDIKRGQILKPEDTSWQVWPEGAVDKSYVVLGTRTPESFAGWVARNPVSGGEPITEAKIIAPGNRGFP